MFNWFKKTPPPVAYKELPEGLTLESDEIQAKDEDGNTYFIKDNKVTTILSPVTISYEIMRTEYFDSSNMLIYQEEANK